MTTKFQSKLAELINCECLENESNTPDYILAQFLKKCLDAFNEATNDRSIHFGNDEARSANDRY